MKKICLFIIFSIPFALWQCSKIDQGNKTLKESLQEGSTAINNAVASISESKGFDLLSLTEDGVKSDMDFHDSINLELIAGVYDFSPVPELHPEFFFPYRFFKKTGESENLEINLPEQLVFHPKRLHFFVLADSDLENNFNITATDYHFYYTWWNNYNYKLDAGFTLDSEDIGNMSISSVWNSFSSHNYQNQYNFPEGYSLIRTGMTGDTARYEFALAQDNDTLLKETLMFTGDGFKKREKQYSLKIGDVEIRRGTGIDSIQVWFDGVLQQKAGAKIMNNDDYNASLFSRRDILLTFDDGTQTKLSDLIAPSLETLRGLLRSLDEMYFSKRIVDYIAFNIYYNRE
jgi:hypothetical protein